MKTHVYLGDGVTFEYSSNVVKGDAVVVTRTAVLRTSTGTSIYMGTEALEMLRRTLEKINSEHQDNTTRLSD